MFPLIHIAWVNTLSLILSKLNFTVSPISLATTRMLCDQYTIGSIGYYNAAGSICYYDYYKKLVYEEFAFYWLTPFQYLMHVAASSLWKDIE